MRISPNTLQTRLPHQQRNKCNAGFTTMELLVSVSLLAIVVGLILAAYSTANQYYVRSSRNAIRIERLMGVRAALAGTFRNIDYILDARQNSIRFTPPFPDSTQRILTTTGTNLTLDGKPIVSNIHLFAYRLSDKEDAQGHRLLEWEISLEDGSWLGGACLPHVRDRVPDTQR